MLLFVGVSSSFFAPHRRQRPNRLESVAGAVLAKYLIGQTMRKMEKKQGPRINQGCIKVWLQGLKRLMAARDESGVVSHMSKLVPEYEPGERWESLQSAPTSAAS